MIFTIYPRTAKLSLAQDVRILIGMDRRGPVAEVHVSLNELAADVEEAAKVTGLPIIPDKYIFAPEIWLGREESE